MGVGVFVGVGVTVGKEVAVGTGVAVGNGVAVGARVAVAVATGVAVSAGIGVAVGAMVGGTEVGAVSLAQATDTTVVTVKAKIARSRRMGWASVNRYSTLGTPLWPRSRLPATVASIPVQTKQGGAGKPRSGDGLHCGLEAQVPQRDDRVIAEATVATTTITEIPPNVKRPRRMAGGAKPPPSPADAPTLAASSGAVGGRLVR